MQKKKQINKAIAYIKSTFGDSKAFKQLLKDLETMLLAETLKEITSQVRKLKATTTK